MPYDVSKIKQMKHEFKMLTNADAILKMREAIEKNEQHKGRAFQIAHQAYTEMHEHRNLKPPKYKTSCSGCIHRINQMLKNWLKAYDNVGGELAKPKATSLSEAVKPKGLVPLAARRKTLEESSYNEIKESAIEANVYDKAKEMNGGKMPKKATLIDLILKV